MRAGRGRGISVAMKAFGLGFAELSGVTGARTFHHPANANAIAVNRTMGHADAESEL